MSFPTLYDAVPDFAALTTLQRLAENGYWIAYDSVLTREGVLNTQVMTADEFTQKLKNALGLHIEYVCCLCNKQCNGWGHNPVPLVCEEGKRCCGKCNNDRVIPQRIVEASLRKLKKMNY